MILAKFTIEFQDKMPEEKQKKLSEELKKLSGLTKAVGINIIGDSTLNLLEVVDIYKILSEYLSDDVFVSFGADVNENFEKGQKELELTLSDDKDDLKSLITEKQIINL